MRDPAGAEEVKGTEAGRELLSFDETPSGTGLRILDTIERRLFEITTDTAVTPTQTGLDQFLAPVDAAREMVVQRISYPSVAGIYVRDESGSIVTVAEQEQERDLAPDTYSIELNAPIKVYLRVVGPVTITYETGRTTIDFGKPRPVKIGARSHHKRPARTVTTTEDPLALMEAITTLSSALKTTSPERSFPTLRGHPPVIELGDELEIPAVISSPDTDVTIEVPPDLQHIFEVTPLVYYLGAALRSAKSSRIVTDHGFVHSLDDGSDFQESVARTVKQVFFLDCLTRTEGIYDIELQERRQFETRVDIDFPELYGQSIGNRLERYLDIPFETVTDLLPKWKLTTHIVPEAKSVEVLPYAMDELALVRAQNTATANDREEALPGDRSFPNGLFDATETNQGSHKISDSTTESAHQAAASDSLGHTWFGEGAPIGAVHGSLTAYRNRLGRSSTSGDVSVDVVRNDPRMGSTQEVGEQLYGERETLPFDLTYHQELSTAEMEELLTRDIDFLHYIGHVEEDGFECTDGILDANSVADIGVDSFFLNACRSFDQGTALIENGALGGVVTLNDVVNSEAVTVGRTLARLLYLGFPLWPALTVARRETLIGDQYVVIGDGEVSIAQPESGVSFVCRFDQADGGLTLQVETYPTRQKGMGSMFVPGFGDERVHHLNSGLVGPIAVDEAEVARLLEEEDAPVMVDGTLRWTTELELADL